MCSSAAGVGDFPSHCGKLGDCSRTSCVVGTLNTRKFSLCKLSGDTRLAGSGHANSEVPRSTGRTTEFNIIGEHPRWSQPDPR